jgi:hypothetical protein
MHDCDCCNALKAIEGLSARALSLAKIAEARDAGLQARRESRQLTNLIEDIVNRVRGLPL